MAGADRGSGGAQGIAAPAPSRMGPDYPTTLRPDQCLQRDPRTPPQSACPSVAESRIHVLARSSGPPIFAPLVLPMIRAAPSPGAERTLCVLWAAWLIVLPLGHVTGLRNTVAVVTIGATLALSALAPLRRLPARNALLAFTLWATLSVLWSADPATTWARLRSDLYIPLLGYAAAFVYCRSTARHRQLTTAMVIGLFALAALSMVAFLPPGLLEGGIAQEHFAVIDRPLPPWYPGVGDASMYATLCLGPLLAWLSLRSGWRAASTIVTGIALLVILWVSENRNSLVVVPLTLIAYFLLRGIPLRHAAPRARRVALAIAALCLAGAALTMEEVSRARLELVGQVPPAWGHSALLLFARDTRPLMWQEYVRLGRSHSVAGVGYGRTLPSEAYRTRDNEQLQRLDPAAHSHAHNGFINVWLELGFVGLGLLCWVLLALVRAAARMARADPALAPLAAGLYALFLATLLRELSDDFLVYAMATTFWCFAGMLFGRMSALYSAKAHAPLVAAGV